MSDHEAVRSAARTLLLAAWAAIALALATRAEARIVAAQQPVPWRAAALSSTAAAFAIGAWPAASLAGGIVCVALIVAAFADARTGYLFDAVTFPAAVLSALAAVYAGATEAAAAGVLVLVGSFGAVVVCSRGRLMGLGDVKAMYAIGAAFGPALAVFAIFAACVSGIVGAIVRGRSGAGAELRFGPHLAAGSAIALAFGDGVVHGMLGL